MTDLVHRVVLIDGAGALVRGPVPVDDTWPSPRELRDAVGAPTAVEVVPAWRADDGVIVHVLQDAGVASPTEADAVWPPAARALAERASGGGEGWPGWYLPVWREDVAAWVASVLSARGLQSTGDAEIVTWWGLSAVLRIPVTGGGVDAARDVWFKATCAGFHDEAAVTAALERRPGAPVADVIAVDTDRAWMLLADIPGAGEEPDLPTVCAAAAAMAGLQLASLDHSGDPALPVRDADATIRDLGIVVHDSVEAHLLLARGLSAPRPRPRLGARGRRARRIALGARGRHRREAAAAHRRRRRLG